MPTADVRESNGRTQSDLVKQTHTTYCPRCGFGYSGSQFWVGRNLECGQCDNPQWVRLVAEPPTVAIAVA